MANAQQLCQVSNFTRIQKLSAAWSCPHHWLRSHPRLVLWFMLQCETEAQNYKKIYKINQSLPLQMLDYFHWACILSSVKCPTWYQRILNTVHSSTAPKPILRPDQVMAQCSPWIAVYPYVSKSQFPKQRLKKKFSASELHQVSYRLCKELLNQHA